MDSSEGATDIDTDLRIVVVVVEAGSGDVAPDVELVSDVTRVVEAVTGDRIPGVLVVASDSVAVVPVVLIVSADIDMLLFHAVEVGVANLVVV